MELIKLTQAELDEKLRKHRLWLDNAEGGERLCGAYDLSGLNMAGAYMAGANMADANMAGAYMARANMADAKNIPFIPIACPTHGAFTAWKKVESYIIKLRIPEDAKRCSATTSKCRCDKALVLAIENLDGTDSGLTKILNTNRCDTLYKVGEMVSPDSFDENRFNECTHGIHFFVDRGEAERW